MKTIIRAQNWVISGLITAIAIMTGFYELEGWKLLMVAVMGFFLMANILLEAERAYLRGRKNEGKGEAEGTGNPVPGIPWYEYKMRHTGLVEEDGNPGSVTKKVQKRARHNSVIQTSVNR